MTDDELFPDFDGSIESYLTSVSDYSTSIQEEHLSNYREECEVIVKTYLHFYRIPRIVMYSYLEYQYYREEMVKKWLGVWKRFIESLNIIRDSLVLGLQGRIISASSLLRISVESMIRGTFYHHLSQNEFRERATCLRSVSTTRKNETFLDLVEDVIQGIPDKEDVPIELEFKIHKLVYESLPPRKEPSLKAMVQQLEEWEIIDTEDAKFKDVIYNHMIGDLSSYSHSILWTSYFGRGGGLDLALGLSVDTRATEEYTRHFRNVCIVILLLFLASTEELQKTGLFKDNIIGYLNDYPDVESILSSIPDQIRDAIQEY